jgi:hypothetical protein
MLRVCPRVHFFHLQNAEHDLCSGKLVGSELMEEEQDGAEPKMVKEGIMFNMRKTEPLRH